MFHITVSFELLFFFLVRGGLSLREGVQILEMINNTGRLGAMDLVEINPTVGTEQDVNRTVDAGIQLLQAALGFERRGLSPQDTSPMQPLSLNRINKN